MLASVLAAVLLASLAAYVGVRNRGQLSVRKPGMFEVAVTVLERFNVNAL